MISHVCWLARTRLLLIVQALLGCWDPWLHIRCKGSYQPWSSNGFPNSKKLPQGQHLQVIRPYCCPNKRLSNQGRLYWIVTSLVYARVACCCRHLPAGIINTRRLLCITRTSTTARMQNPGQQGQIPPPPSGPVVLPTTGLMAPTGAAPYQTMGAPLPTGVGEVGNDIDILRSKVEVRPSSWRKKTHANPLQLGLPSSQLVSSSILGWQG
jgi:hypothetical protein